MECSWARGYVGGLDRIEAQAETLRSTLLLSAEERSLQARTGAPSTERWLVERFRWSRSRAVAAMTTARTRHEQPAVAAALAEGRMSVEQGDAVSQALSRIDRITGVTPDEWEDAAQFLVGQAAALGPRDLTVVGRLLAETLTRLPSVDNPEDEEALRRDQERAEREALARERNALRLSRARDGRYRAVLDLGPLGEAIVRAWLKNGGRRVPGSDGFDDDRGLAERRADSLVDLLDASAADGRLHACDDDVFDRRPDSAPPAPSPPMRAASPVALLTLTVTLAELRAALTGAGILETGATVSAATLRRLACDALVVPAVIGGPSEVLDLGRARRLHSPASVGRSSCATGRASPPAATGHRETATSTTTRPGSTAGPPTPSTGSSSATSTTTGSTSKAGRSG